MFPLVANNNVNYTPHTLKFVFRYKREFMDNKDIKDMINNKNRSKNEFSSVMSIGASLFPYFSFKTFF
jgi:hypothetical protein